MASRAFRTRPPRRAHSRRPPAAFYTLTRTLDTFLESYHPSWFETPWNATTRTWMVRLIQHLTQQSWTITQRGHHVVLLTHAAYPGLGIVVGKQWNPRRHTWHPTAFVRRM